MKNSMNAGISLPVKWMNRIDQERGDIPRSRYLLRLLEKAYSKETLQQSVESRVQVSTPVVTAEVVGDETAMESDSCHE